MQCLFQPPVSPSGHSNRRHSRACERAQPGWRPCRRIQRAARWGHHFGVRVEQCLRCQQRRRTAVVVGAQRGAVLRLCLHVGDVRAANEDATGGLSAGFKGSGGSAPTDLNFPWTTDCSISEATPRTWIQSGIQVTNVNYGPSGVAPGACDTVGNASGWNYTNSEVESTDTAISPATDFQTLTLSIWCARDSNCSAGDAANYAVTNLSGTFDDSSNKPSGSASWNTSIDGAKWYQTNTGNLKLDVSASDPAGVCSMARHSLWAGHRQRSAGESEPDRHEPWQPHRCRVPIRHGSVLDRYDR